MTTSSNPPTLSEGVAPMPVQWLRPVQVDPSQHLRGQPHLSAVRGLVRVRHHLYLVGDDDRQIAMLDEVGEAVPDMSEKPPLLGKLWPLEVGDLPKDKLKRKKTKLDLETLAHLPALPGCPAGALLALSSGSRPDRETGVLVALDVQGVPNGRMALVDLTALYAPLHKRFVDLNIEAALVVSGELLLLQRGSKGNKLRSACIRYDWNQIAPWLAGRQPQPPAAKGVQVLELGRLNDAPLGFTDAVALHGGAWAFCAVAERVPAPKLGGQGTNSVSSVNGSVTGSVIGIVNAEGKLTQLHPVDGAFKVEGIAAQADGSDWVFTLVADPEDPALPAQLLQVRLPQA